MKHQRKIKAICSAILAVCVLISLSISISARYSHIALLYAELSINENGYASCGAECALNANSTAKAVLELQQKKGSTWETIKEWSASGRKISFDKAQFVASGYDYRLKISADIYDSNGNFVEDGTSYSTIERF
ncbi:hypothetical protein NE584_03925 [Clostridium sp. DFI.5.61]|uniref:hypothetical protein n=1 Tax=Clostridium sp. DFI.5.61 TaxID=2965279 RepID=UPI00210C6DC1|nr:hypothetical protein [Clostridium sp. DFI.5.61]MCB5925251.1 hypothetical protein [bacterium 210820-DFI.5.26]MCQ5158187.1 hypothetical protein [Clostridium sp. DFI.5.61]